MHAITRSSKSVKPTFLRVLFLSGSSQPSASAGTCGLHCHLSSHAHESCTGTADAQIIPSASAAMDNGVAEVAGQASGYPGTHSSRRSTGHTLLVSPHTLGYRDRCSSCRVRLVSEFCTTCWRVSCCFPARTPCDCPWELLHDHSRLHQPELYILGFVFILRPGCCPE